MIASCILPTYNRRSFIAKSISYFLAQTHANKELIVVDDGTDCIRDLIPLDDRIRYIRLDNRQSVGAKRNLACREARGDIILHWDDDDWYAPWRIEYQVTQLAQSNKDICGLNKLFYYDPSQARAWEYNYTSRRVWVAGNTLCYRKQFWQAHQFPEIDIGEDSRFLWQAKPDRIVQLEDSRFLVAFVHNANVSAKITSGCFWKQVAVETVLELMNDSVGKQSALVTASLGLGDILRVTPLARALHGMGYSVDLLIQPDYPETAELLRGAAEIQRVYSHSRQQGGELPTGEYDVATFTYWSSTLQSQINAARKLSFNRDLWLREGDTISVERIAHELGWQNSLPPPIAIPSSRQFDLPPGTLAIHTGCKPDWPWKKWHGFDELAERFPHVVLVGTAKDFNNRGTYFDRDFHWPRHIHDYSGQLSLRDTAALLSQCAAVVANDSGIMHLSAALGVPTFGIFGITSPQREAMPLPNMFPVTKGLPCETGCRQKPWGRRDCERHLECLKTLGADDVARQIHAHLHPRASVCDTNQNQDPTMTKIGVTYHGHVFDASGYGNAARAYVHALHAVGIDLSVVDLSAHAPQVRDPLIESLVGRRIRTDFELFHGIPHVWAQKAFRVPNAIAITVWETDTMPPQWRNTLDHALETWLPCDFNLEAFRSHLRRPVAKLPHPVLPRNGHSNGLNSELLEISPDTFVVYSIFEWQERKSPLEQLICFLRTFSSNDNAVFVVKTNPGAANIAARALEEARCQTNSDGRVILCPEAWEEDKIASLHQRGDCYLSLHRGEGWGYPLFEAVCAGTPVVATAYSGPLEYLDPAVHQLVPFCLVSVTQKYLYYHARMKWAQPDINDAASRLRWIYAHKGEASSTTREAAARIQRRYSLEAVGNIAKKRLMDLLERSNHSRWLELRNAESSRPLPSIPIPGEWFDADYFENGFKSNWLKGYHWKDFAGLFRETAAFLASMFPNARSYFDAGCAKGFLVRALREMGLEARGCDVSTWAIDHAETAAHQYLKCAPAESVEWEHDYDVLVAFHLLPQMTKEQATAFLARARPHIKIALLAAIPVFDGEGARTSEAGDIAHITQQTSAWWNECILSTGWRQDALHKSMEHVCQLHPLPTRMGWKLFVYSPG